MKYLIYLLPFILTIPVAYGVPEIRVNPYTEVKGGQAISLKQIISIVDIDSALRDKIEGVELGNAPKIGEKRVYSAAALAEILRQIVSESGLDGIHLNIPNKIVIENKGNGFTEKIISHKILQLWENVCKTCRFSGLKLQIPIIDKSVRGKPWKIEYDNTLPRSSFTYKISFSGERIRTYWMSGKVQVKKKVMVAKRAIAYHELLTPDSVQIEFRDISFATDTSPNIKDLQSVITKRALRAGEIIWHGSLTKQKKIRRGDIVKAVLSEGSWMIGVTGIAQEDGYVGEKIKIKSVTTKKLLVGIVKKDGEVEIE